MPRGRPRKNVNDVIVVSPTTSGSASIETTIEDVTPIQEDVIQEAPVQRAGDKPVERLYAMKTKKIKAEKIFLFVSQDTLPKEEINRFLRLCESMILSLGEESLSDNDVEEIALIYRDRIYTDRQYKVFATEPVLDTTMVSQIEKLNKALEQRKTNLGARFIDKGKKRGDNGAGDSFVELFNYFVENKDGIDKRGAEKKKQIEENKEKFTSVSEYMKSQTTFTSATPKKDGEGE